MPKRGRAPKGPTEHISSGDEDTNAFLDDLTRTQVLDLNAAFDRHGGTAAEQRAQSAKRRKTSSLKRRDKGKQTAKEPSPAPGGFLLDEDDEHASGGFMPDTDEGAAGGFVPEQLTTLQPGPRFTFGDTTDESDDPQAAFILLDRIPSCLDELNLDGDDPSVLDIFSNAAEEDEEGVQIVQRKQFLKVASILLAQKAGEDELVSRNKTSSTKKARATQSKRGLDEGNESDPLVLSSDESDDDLEQGDSDPWADEDDEAGGFVREVSPPSTRRATRSLAKGTVEATPPEAAFSPSTAAGASKGKGKTKLAHAGPKEVKKELSLSKQQREECNRMFQQFFSSTDPSNNNAIGAAEIRYVCTLLNEKISDADVSHE